MLILIMGDFGVGKDTIADMFVDYLGDEACKIKSWTTRPPRFKGEDTHFFIDDETAQSFSREETLAYCKIGDYHYWTTFSQFGQKKYEFYVIDRESVYQVASRFRNPFIIIEVRRPFNLIDVDKDRLNRRRIKNDSFDHKDFNANIVYNNFSTNLEDLYEDVIVMAEMIKQSFE